MHRLVHAHGAGLAHLRVDLEGLLDTTGTVATTSLVTTGAGGSKSAMLHDRT
jgi:hypothetical protein